MTAILARYGLDPKRIGWGATPRLNQAHPLSEFIVGLWVPSQGSKSPKLANLVTPYIDEPTLQRTNASASTPGGMICASNSSGTGPAYHITVSDRLKINAPLTFMWWGSMLGTAGQTNDRIIGVDYDAVDGTPFMCYGFYRSTTTTAAQAAWNRAGTFTNVTATSGQALSSPGHGQSLALALDGSGGASAAKSYCNAIAGTSGQSPAPTINYSANSCLRIDGPTGTRNGNFGTTMAALFDTQLPAEWILRLHLHPGEFILEPWRAARYFGYVAPAAGTFLFKALQQLPYQLEQKFPVLEYPKPNPSLLDAPQTPLYPPPSPMLEIRPYELKQKAYTLKLWPEVQDALQPPIPFQTLDKPRPYSLTQSAYTLRLYPEVLDALQTPLYPYPLGFNQHQYSLITDPYFLRLWPEVMDFTPTVTPDFIYPLPRPFPYSIITKPYSLKFPTNLFTPEAPIPTHPQLLPQWYEPPYSLISYKRQQEIVPLYLLPQDPPPLLRLPYHRRRPWYETGQRGWRAWLPTALLIPPITAVPSVEWDTLYAIISPSSRFGILLTGDNSYDVVVAHSGIFVCTLTGDLSYDTVISYASAWDQNIDINRTNDG